MIKLQRRRGASDLHKQFTGPGLGTKLKALAEARIADGDKLKFEGILGDWTKVKPALRKESGDKCAYCEQWTADVTHGDVEHFRPKSRYWWLALCVDNYVYACELCNQTYKGDKFPIRGRKLTEPSLPKALPQNTAQLGKLLAALCPDPATVTDLELVQKWFLEDADLPHPYLEDPESLFAWRVAEVAGEVILVAPDGASSRAKRAVAAAIDCLGLNRETLRRSRYLVYTALQVAIRNWTKHKDQEDLAQVREMCSQKWAFSGMSRYFARQAKIQV